MGTRPRRVSSYSVPTRWRRMGRRTPAAEPGVGVVGTRIALGANGPFDSDRFVTIVAPLRGRGGARRRGRAALAVPISDLRAGLGGHRHRSLGRANTAARAAARG